MSQEIILLVDDQTENISVLYTFLRQFDYELLVAVNGEFALSIVAETRPDLILLDVMMPGLDGFEVCRRLKENPESAEIPVIFMTALTETQDKLAGFAAGGVDYITKPFSQEEVLARIRTQLTLARQRDELWQKNRELDAFAHTVAHDLKNPLSGIMGYAGLVRLECDEKNPNIDEIKSLAQGIAKAAAKASDIVESLLLLAGTSHHNTLHIEAFDMGHVIGSVQERMEPLLKQYGTTLQLPPQWPFIEGYPAWVEEIWANYISNALKYGGTPPQVELGLDEYEDSIRFWVRDNGPGLTPEQQAQLFVPFTRLHTHRADGHGLGLSIVRSIMEKLGGSAGVESTPGQGSRFYFVLPRRRAPHLKSEI